MSSALASSISADAPDLRQEVWARLLARQLDRWPQVLNGAPSFTMTSENPRPSVVGYQSSS